MITSEDVVFKTHFFHFMEKSCSFLEIFNFSRMMLCAIWYHLHNLKNVKNNPWRSVTFSEVAQSVLNFKSFHEVRKLAKEAEYIFELSFDHKSFGN